MSTLAVLALAVVLWTALPPKAANAFACGHLCGTDVGALCGDPTLGASAGSCSWCNGGAGGPCVFCCGGCPGGCGGGGATPTPTSPPPPPTPTPAPPSVSLSGTASFCAACGASGTYAYSAKPNGGPITHWTLRIDGGPTLASGGGKVTSTLTWNGSGLAAGAYVMRITAVDINGQIASATQPVTLVAAPTPSAPTITLYRDYASLLYYGPKLGQPAQRLYGSASGGSGPPYTLTLTLTRPDATTISYIVASDGTGSFQLTTASSGDPYLGATQVGTWSARAVIGGGAVSNTVSWTVQWFQVNERP